MIVPKNSKQTLPLVEKVTVQALAGFLTVLIIDVISIGHLPTFFS